MADSNPDLNSSPQESGQPRPDANQQVSPEHAAARTEAARIQDAEKQGGPGEALQELIAGQLPGEIIATTAAGRVYSKELGRNDLTDAQKQTLEGESALVQQRSAQISGMHGELSTLSANLDGVIAKREAETPPVEGLAIPTEAPEDTSTVKDEVAVTPPAAVVEGEELPTPPEESPAPPEPLTPEPEPEPDPEPSENLIKMAEQVKASQETAKAKRDEYKVMSRDQLQDEITELNEGLAGYQGILTGARGLSAGDREYIFKEMANARAELVEIRRAIADKQRVASERQIFDELRGRVKTSVESAANMTGFTTDQLKEASGKYKSSAEILQASLEAERQKTNPNADLIRAYELELNDSKARAGESQRLFEEKDKEIKQKQAEADAKKADEDVEKARREAASVPALEANIKKLDNELRKLEKDIDKAEKDLNAATTDDAKETARKKLLDLENKELDIRNSRTKDQEALEDAKEKDRKEAGFKDRRGEGNIRQLTVGEYQELDEEGRAKYIKEVGEAVKNPTANEIRRIEDAISKGVGLSVKEMAQYSRYMSELFITGGRKKGDLEMIQVLNERYPEMVQTIFDKVTSHREVQQKFKEMFPSNWDKMLKFAKEHPSWLLMILALLAVPAVAAVGVPAAAMASGKVFSKGLV